MKKSPTQHARRPFDPGPLCSTGAGKLRTGGWILTAKLAFFVTLGLLRFVGETTSLPVGRACLCPEWGIETSRRYPTPLHFGDFPRKVRRDFPLQDDVAGL